MPVAEQIVLYQELAAHDAPRLVLAFVGIHHAASTLLVAGTEEQRRQHLPAILDGEPEHWRTMLETNVLSLLAGCQAAVRAMRACGAEGHVVNISSIAALRADSGVYGATKHAVNCISATLRRELEDDTIRVVNVMPGGTAGFNPP